MIRVTEMKTLRTIMEKIRNTDIREQCGVQDIVRWREKKKYWYAQVIRMEEREDYQASHLKGNQ